MAFSLAAAISAARLFGSAKMRSSLERTQRVLQVAELRRIHAGLEQPPLEIAQVAVPRLKLARELADLVVGEPAPVAAAPRTAVVPTAVAAVNSRRIALVTLRVLLAVAAALALLALLPCCPWP